MTREKQLERSLLAMFLDAEERAVRSYETCTYPGGVFNDKIWREHEPGTFKRLAATRKLLGLAAFAHRDRRHFGRADDHLADFRKKALRMVKP